MNTHILIALLPVLFFLYLLYSLDTYKLIKGKVIVWTVCWGVLSACLAFPLNRWMFGVLDESTVTRAAAPVAEELLKFGIIYLLASRKRIGFLADAMILGFAVGTGFSMVENAYYLYAVQDPNLMLWVVRGLGTAVMHGATTAIAAVVFQYMNSRSDEVKLIHGIMASCIGILLHSGFNAFVLSPIQTTALQLVCFPLIGFAFFALSERMLREWMESQFDSEFEMLQKIRSGEVKETRVGRYLLSIKQSFPPETIVDMMAYIHLYVDLSFKAKGILLKKEMGIPVAPDPELEDKLEELDVLNRNIGKTGMRMLQTLVNVKNVDLWKLKALKGS